MLFLCRGRRGRSGNRCCRRTAAACRPAPFRRSPSASGVGGRTAPAFSSTPRSSPAVCSAPAVCAAGRGRGPSADRADRAVVDEDPVVHFRDVDLPFAARRYQLRRLVEFGRDTEVAREMVERPQRQYPEHGLGARADAAAPIVPSPPPTTTSLSPRSATALQRTAQSPASSSSTFAVTPASFSALATFFPISGSAETAPPPRFIPHKQNWVGRHAAA